VAQRLEPTREAEKVARSTSIEALATANDLQAKMREVEASGPSPARVARQAHD